MNTFIRQEDSKCRESTDKIKSTKTQQTKVRILLRLIADMQLLIIHAIIIKRNTNLNALLKIDIQINTQY